MTVKADYTRGQRPTVSEMNTFAGNPALKYISQININANSTTIASGFNSTYFNYHLEFSNLRSSVATVALLSLTGGTGTSHHSSYRTTSETGAVTLNNSANAAYWLGIHLPVANVGSQVSMDIFSPFVSLQTQYQFQASSGYGGTFGGGINTNNTSYVGFSIVGLFGSVIQGTLRIYGYRRS
jgi:hypothetical protein